MRFLRWCKLKALAPFQGFVWAGTSDLRGALRRLSYLDPDVNSIARILHTHDLQEKLDLLRMEGVRIGKGVFIDRDVWLDFAFLERIEIEDYVHIGARAMLIVHDGALRHIRGMPVRTGKIHLKRNCNIGAGACILPGVTVGVESIVGVSAVVTHDVPDRVVVAGVPARVISTLEEHVERMKRRMAQHPADFVVVSDPERTPPEWLGAIPPS